MLAVVLVTGGCAKLNPAFEDAGESAAAGTESGAEAEGDSVEPSASQTKGTSGDFVTSGETSTEVGTTEHHDTWFTTSSSSGHDHDDDGETDDVDTSGIEPGRVDVHVYFTAPRDGAVAGLRADRRAVLDSICEDEGDGFDCDQFWMVVDVSENDRLVADRPLVLDDASFFFDAELIAEDFGSFAFDVEIGDALGLEGLTVWTGVGPMGGSLQCGGWSTSEGLGGTSSVDNYPWHGGGSSDCSVSHSFVCACWIDPG